MSRVIRCAAALALVVLPRLARAQEPRLAGRLDPETRSAVEAIMDLVRPLGIPSEPLVNKALEGASKGADGPRIVAAVRSLATDLGRARTALGEAASTAELVAGASALRAGVAAEVLRRLRELRPRRSMAVPLAVLTDLVARSVPVDTAVVTILTLAEAELRDAELLAFRQNVERDIALGAPAGAAASTRVSGAVLSSGDERTQGSPPRPRRP